MNNRNRIILALAVVFAVVASTAWLVERPKRITEAFVGHLSHERYEEAEQMLQAPSALKMTLDGGIVLVDRAGNSTAIPADKLPFLAGGGEANGPGDFAMTALGNRTNRRLNSPAVIAYLSLEGRKIHIERVDAL